MKEAPMPSCAAEAAIDPFAASHSVFDALALELGAEEAARLGHAELEDLLELRGRELLRQLLQDHLDLRQIREERAVRARPTPVTGADGVTRRAVETGHRRLLASIFGTVVVGRCAWRAQGRVNVYPADAALRLPRGRHSHGLRRLAALEAVRGSFDQATEAIGRRCGPVVGKRGVEQLTVAAAADIDAFYRAVVPQPCSDATVLVLSVDGKGVVMRPEALREATVKAAQAKGANTYRTRLASGEKQGRKRMATLGVVYDATPAPRRAHDVICVPAATAEGRSGQRPRRGGPKAQAKWLTGSITQSSEQVIKAVFDQAEQRDPTHRRTWVVLVDGARHQLDLIRAEAVRRNVTVHILVDFIHVLEYLWKAAWCFYSDADPAAEPWVAGHALKILAGDVDAVITSVQTQAADAGLTAHQRGGVDTCIGYLTAKRELLGYNTALARGWPIATGVIEGACRHLVGDRLDITGARWGLHGAEAVLKLRALWTNGDFPAYWQFHVRREAPRIRVGMKGPHRCLVAARQ
jgi:hypothetical protein